MKRFLMFLAGTLAIIAAAVPVSAVEDNQAAIRRFAIFVGANDGGRERETLRYAVRDAESTAKLFRDMGGIKSADGELLVEPSLNELTAKLKSISTRIERAKEQSMRTEFVFYYSGHSDEEGMLLGEKKYSYKDLKDTIEALPADMKIVILDSCSSGALTKVKGGTKTQPFLMDNSITMKGYAFLTSSSADEASQESESLKGSYFTYALLSGLRGAADLNGDGKVTIDEAYQYAYNETLAKTERTIGGSQHPNYDIRMKGSGDVVMTDLRETSASLRFAKDVSGKIFIRDEGDVLVSEITKAENRTLELGLAPGSYRVTVENNKVTMQALLFLNDNDRVELTKAMLKPVKQEKTVSRGGTLQTNTGDETALDTTNSDDGQDSLGVAERARAGLNGRSNSTNINRNARDSADRVLDNTGDQADNGATVNRNTLGSVNVNVNVNTGNNTQNQNQNQNQNMNQDQQLDSYGVAERARSNAAAFRAQKSSESTSSSAAVSNLQQTNSPWLTVNTDAIVNSITSGLSNIVLFSNGNMVFQFQATPVPAGYAYIPVNVGFVPGLDVNTFLKSGKSKVVNNISASAFMGMSDRVYGVAGAGFMQSVGEELVGVAGAGFMSFFGNVTGVVGSGFMTFSHDVSGVQGSGFLDFTHDFTGVIGSGFMTFAHDVKGVEGSGFASVANDILGVQGAGFINFAQDVSGIQGAGFASFARDVEGMQAAGGFVAARNVDGLQASVVNIAGGKVSGAQIGIVNISGEMDGAPIGLVSIIGKGGQTHLQAYADETGFLHVALLNGSKNFYNIYTVGANLLGTNFFKTGTVNSLSQYQLGLGFGAALPLWIFSANIEGISSATYAVSDPTKVSYINQIRLYGSVNLFLVTLLAGVSFNEANYQPSFLNYGSITASIDTPYLKSSITVKPPASFVLPFSTENQVFWPGFFVGIQF
jgi:hypothetical protein